MNDRSTSRRVSPGLTVLILVAAALLALLAYSLSQLRAGIEAAHDRGEEAVEMILATYTLRQSSDYLTRFARAYAATGEPAWRDVYQQVLDIRRGEALRPKDYESIYWDLTEPYRSNAHPLLYPQSLRSILEGLAFTPEELALLQESELNSEALAEMEMDAFEAVAEGRRDEALEALFSIAYLREKHAIMRPIDELMVRIRRRVEAEREASLAELRAHMALVMGTSVAVVLGSMVLLVRRRAGGRGARPKRVKAEVPQAAGGD
jgi:hypothetical protein